MGIDARLLLKIKGKENWFTPESLRKISVKLAATIGSENFWIDNPGSKNSSHVLDIMKPEEGNESEHKGKVVWYQDGEEIIAESNEQFIKCDISGRYYGKGYERGDFPTLYILFRWIRKFMPDAEIWYGGDSSGKCVELFNDAAIESLLQYYLEKNGNHSYQSFFGQMDSCHLCQIPYLNVGGGGGMDFLKCAGCGHKMVTLTGARYSLPKWGREDFFTFSSKIEKGEIQPDNP